MVDRRTFLSAVTGGLLAAPLAAEAQQAPKVAQVGVLAGGSPGFHAGFEPFRQRLRELGYVEDQTLALLVRDAEGRADRYSELAAELVRSGWTSSSCRAMPLSRPSSRPRGRSPS